ncbi:hypothetical protein SEA_CHADMASTERC_3 [Gordonia phage ChadMasterC]|nr:hypothetical protein SEA_CHADMASTERC_3 [Gordonia phage ChadMasterC]
MTAHTAAADRILAEVLDADEQQQIVAREIDPATGSQIVFLAIDLGVEIRIINLDGSSFYVIIDADQFDNIHNATDNL